MRIEGVTRPAEDAVKYANRIFKTPCAACGETDHTALLSHQSGFGLKLAVGKALFLIPARPTNRHIGARREAEHKHNALGPDHLRQARHRVDHSAGYAFNESMLATGDVPRVDQHNAEPGSEPWGRHVHRQIAQEYCDTARRGGRFTTRFHGESIALHAKIPFKQLSASA